VGLLIRTNIASRYSISTSSIHVGNTVKSSNTVDIKKTLNPDLKFGLATEPKSIKKIRGLYQPKIKIYNQILGG
jgi:hypothetical protein